MATATIVSVQGQPVWREIPSFVGQFTRHFRCGDACVWYDCVEATWHPYLQTLDGGRLGPIHELPAQSGSVAALRLAEAEARRLGMRLVYEVAS